MASINCPQKECNRIFQKPVIVTNFSFVPKETYSACPHCLTRINIESKEYSPTCIDQQTIQVFSLTGKSGHPLNSLVSNSQTPRKNAIRSIKNLEQEKTDLITKLDELKKVAIEKIGCLEKEVAILREEAKILKKLVSA